MPAFFPPSLAGWSLTSMPACHSWGCLRAGLVGCRCTPAAQTDQHSWPPSLAGWPSTSMLGCIPAAQADQHSFTPLLRWLTIAQHASMPACHSWGCRRADRGCIRGCWPCGHSPTTDDRNGLGSASLKTRGAARMAGGPTASRGRPGTNPKC
jgi:hypothetical protein